MQEMPASIPARKFRSLRYTQGLFAISSTVSPRFLWKAISSTFSSLASRSIFLAGIASICRHLAGHFSIELNMPIQHRKKTIYICRIAFFYYHIQNQSTSARAQVQLMSILDISAAFDDDVSMLLKDTENLFN